ncbi:YihY/virulence factor BrkB family protein [soil metagenome]
MPSDSPGDPRGRTADRPSEIPKRGWKEIGRRIKDSVTRDRVTFVAAGVAFYILVGIVPTLAVIVSLYGLMADPSDVTRQVEQLEGLIPPTALEIIDTELTRVASSEKEAGIGAIVGILFALWGGSKAMDALITSLNIAYGENERRGFVKRKLLGLALTLGAALFVILTVAILVGIPLVLAVVGLGGFGETLLAIVRWPLLFVIATLAISLLYRYAPHRADAKWRWISWGSVTATVLWVLGSAVFSYYASRFGDFNKSYGSLGAIVLLLLWFYITGFAIILGAEMNSELERQTEVDTTTDPPKPMGERGAFVADTPPPTDQG